MNIENLTSLEGLESFLQGNQVFTYCILGNKLEHYQFIRKILIKFSHITCSRKG